MRSTMFSIDRVKPNQEASRLDRALVQRSVALLRDGWDEKKVPPVMGYVYTERDSHGDHVDVLYIEDGHHRYAAALELGYSAIPTLNRSEMNGGDVRAYRGAIKRYRALIEHPHQHAAPSLAAQAKALRNEMRK